MAIATAVWIPLALLVAGCAALADPVPSVAREFFGPADIQELRQINAGEAFGSVTGLYILVMIILGAIYLAKLPPGPPTS